MQPALIAAFGPIPIGRALSFPIIFGANKWIHLDSYPAVINITFEELRFVHITA
jgi:hypothetical protein